MLELYLQVKVRSDNEIDGYNEEVYKLEKLELIDKSGFDIVEMVKEAVESIM